MMTAGVPNRRTRPVKSYLRQTLETLHKGTEMPPHAAPAMATVARAVIVAAAGAAVVRAAPAADLVDLSSAPMPGFPADVATPFDVYSGFLNVSGVDVAGYDGWSIHYEFHTSQASPSTDPLMVWHTGGPGGSSIYGAWYVEASRLVP